ncbi:hypothetical protein HRI_004008600 [Hibiscus trionum]|uniref:Uncharacterized protein n=1 Tax=Hibiscus trionum TaxID=183268 RepID=A0A9W7IY44_HIBTR|nr:hypothetical protein HRI_004008600 [Hibiscus trionum]
MSIFGSLSSAITPDYFGDEFGLPLPRYSTSVENKVAVQVKASDRSGGPAVPDSKRTTLEQPKDGIKFRGGELVSTPSFDGLLPFETLAIRNSK